MPQVSLVLEGGARRGLFTSGVLDYFMEHGLYLPYVTGSSAGACNASSYISRQIGRMSECSIPKDKTEDFVNVRSILRKRTMLDMDLLFDDFPNKLYPFDFETYAQSPIRCDYTVTNCLTGQVEYMDERQDRERLLQIVRASSSLPVMSKMVEIDGVPYCDGGVADAVPLFRAMKQGYQKNIVILTRGFGYRKHFSERSQKLYQVALRKYPKLLETLATRHIKYNRLMEYLEQQEREKTGRVLVIRPSVPVISRLERDRKKLGDFYIHGYRTAETMWPQILEYVGLQTCDSGKNTI
ncbi:MAG: patatin family protein [Lachnospiraceae bacterium]|nr:patatin family protein [Lachnospiraceae bacterium]